MCSIMGPPYMCKSQNVHGDCNFLTKTKCTYCYCNVYMKGLNKLNCTDLIWVTFVDEAVTVSKIELIRNYWIVDMNWHELLNTVEHLLRWSLSPPSYHVFYSCKGLIILLFINVKYRNIEMYYNFHVLDVQYYGTTLAHNRLC